MAKDRESVTTNGRAVFYASIWNDLRQKALDNGWALGLHGSLEKDMDIMAMPWVKNAVNENDLIESLTHCFTDSNKIKYTRSEMPNNRIVFTLIIWADFYLDINIIKTTTL